MKYRAIRQWADLPPRGPLDASESSTLDFKAEHRPDAAEHAKDMAAFANALGGTILVGVPEKADTYSRRLLSVEAANRAARDYEDAARDLLAPRPLVDPVVLRSPTEDTGAIVAVNVDPFAGQLVGAKLPGTQGWRFPVRTAARHCTYVDPEKLMIYSDPRARKAAILLASIPAEQRKMIQVQLIERRDDDQSYSSSEHVLDGELISLEVEANTVGFSVYASDRSQIVRFATPFEDIEAVWKATGCWTVRVNGKLRFYLTHDGRRAVQYISGLAPYEWA